VFVSLVNFHVLFALQVQGLIPLHLILVIIYFGLKKVHYCLVLMKIVKYRYMVQIDNECILFGLDWSILYQGFGIAS